ncbi:hypothetical protein [Brevibacterium luteolum]|uniref:Uncharacterized protein n=1 Tax=Brevibacterium luteolum TaxID=199591 RepID=A0A2N6PII0_9MICO|nr:hypothetical protein [Brevibacterium luteolum]PMB98486.1 hypothetical protein CJ198_03860 [Brevibacterium luteolum]
MTEFKVGDIVRMTKGEPDKPGYRVDVRTVTEGYSESPEINLLTLRAFENARWTVELIERPAPPLPTKPNALGWATVDGRRYLARLSYDQWELYNTDGVLGATPHPSAIEGFEEAVLIPKELADKVVSWSNDAHRRGWLAGSILQQVADHLKGQDDE